MLKKCVVFASTVAIWPLYIIYQLLSFCCDRNSLFTSFSQFLSLIPGKTGSYLRNSFYHLTLTRCEQGVVFSFGSVLTQIDTEIGSGTYIGPHCNIGSCKIGKDCLVGSGVHILSGKQQHAFEDLSKPIRDQGGCLTKIRIGDDCWIGNGAIIMANLGSQCVVAAGAVVVNSVTDRSIVAGNPAVVIKDRT
jgi:acetyltransferase-like isoleucine patch superfamily enzyme